MGFPDLFTSHRGLVSIHSRHLLHSLQALRGLHLKATGPGVTGLDEELVLVKEFKLQPLVLLEVVGEEKAKARIPKSCILQSKHGKETLPWCLKQSWGF